MRSRSRAELRSELLGLLPAAASATAEGAWIAVVYLALQVGLAGRPEIIGVWIFVAAAAAGMIVARRVQGRLGRYTTFVLVAVAAIVGWAADPEVRESIAGGAYDQGLVAGFGWILGLAVWRGSRHGEPDSDDLVAGSVLTWVVPGLAIPWLVGSGTAYRQAFVDVALPATLLFVAAGLVAVGLTRLEALARAVGVDWRRNRAWLVLLVGVVGLVVAIGTPTAFALGASVEAIGRMILGPVDAVAAALNATLGPTGDAIGHLVTPAPASLPGATAPGGPAGSLVPGWAGPAIAVGLGAALLAGVVVLFRMPTDDRPPVEELQWDGQRRRIVLPSLSVRLPTLRLPRLAFPHRVAPKTASEAYLAFLHGLEGDELRARSLAETPAAHARRLRAKGVGSLSLDLLAADFELERYGDATLTPPEVRRALARSRSERPSRRRAQAGG